jgi:hypothetical protein
MLFFFFDLARFGGRDGGRNGSSGTTRRQTWAKTLGGGRRRGVGTIRMRGDF